VQEVVITGIGIACPLGVGRADVWSTIENRQSGVRSLPHLVEANYPVPIGGVVPDFEPKQYVKPRKSLKVMCRETQLGFTAAEFAWEDAALAEAIFDPDRIGVVLGTNSLRSEIDELAGIFRAACKEQKFDIRRWSEGMRELYPLWMLKYLPNMTACHVGIAHDCRGPNNSIIHGDVSSLHAMIEAADVIARGHADIMIAGGASSMLSLVDLAWHGGARMSRRIEDPAGACRPFDADRSGAVGSEGSAVFVLESRAHAQQRGVKIQASLLGYGRRCEPCADTKQPTGQSIGQAIEAALTMSQMSANDIGHVNAHGLGTCEDDAIEAQKIEQILGDVPVTALKSFMGNLGAAGGAAELAISLMGLEQGLVPPTLNYEKADPACPVNVVTKPQAPTSPIVLALNHKLTGQASALLVRAE